MFVTDSTQHESPGLSARVPDDQLHRVNRLQALDAARGGHQAYWFVRQVRRIVFGQQDQPVQRVLERAADGSVVVQIIASQA
jgi:hypothetical protein